MTSVEGNVNSYECGSAPYPHDKQRGKWSSNWDFYFASFGNAFGFRNIAFLPIVFQYLGVTTFLICGITLILNSIPIYFLQSSVGQFSSTGFISVFRMSPMFKGIGYVILLLNITSVTYNTLFASYSITYVFRSLTTQLPWMTCGNPWNTDRCQTLYNESTGQAENRTSIFNPWLLTRDYFATTEYLIGDVLKITNYKDSENSISWVLVGSNLFVWICVFGCIFKGIESVSKASRYTISIAFLLFLTIFLRFLLLPGATSGIKSHMLVREIPTFHGFFLALSPIINLACLGSGWGTLLTMASYNNFKTNARNYSLIIPFGLLALTLMSSIFVFSGYGYLLGNRNVSIDFFVGHELTIPFSIMSFIFGLIEASSFWSCSFYIMLFLFELNGITIQIFSVLTALFDEFISLRQYKFYVSLIICIIMFFGSIYFVTKFGYLQFRALIIVGTANQMIICFLELMVVLWIYGRQRFQRDMKHMTGGAISTWQFFVIRFTTPFFCIAMLIFCFIFGTSFYLCYENFSSIFLVSTIQILPWIAVPAYIIYKLSTTVGMISKRFKKCVQPTDWYPAEAADRHDYEKNLGTSDNSHQLVEGGH